MAELNLIQHVFKHITSMTSHEQLNKIVEA